MSRPERLRLTAFSRAPGVIAAQARGLFAREGLDVAFARATSSRAQIRGLLAGEWDVAHTAADNVMAHVDAEGADLVVFLVGTLGATQKLVARSEVVSPTQLRGRALGVDSPTSGHALLLYKLLALEGVPREAYAVRALGGTAERLAALRAGTVDAAFLSPPHDALAAESGLRVLARASDRFPGYPGLTAAARRSWAADHREVVVRYCRALLAGLRWAAEPRHREAVIELLAAELGLNSWAAGGKGSAQKTRRDAAPSRPGGLLLGRATAELLYEDEVRGCERTAPDVAQMEHALARVAALRREMTDRTGAEVDLAAYFDPSYALAADPTLAAVRS